MFKECLPRQFGELIQFDLRIFLQMGWFNHQLDLYHYSIFKNKRPNICVCGVDLITGIGCGFQSFQVGMR